MEVYGIVYLLIDGTNDREYVGQTIQTLEQRMNGHKCGNQYIDRVIRKRGADMLATAILKVCYSKEELNYWEKRLIKSRDTMAPNGYNLTDGGEGGIPCDEVRAKMSTSQSGEKNPNYGKHHSASTRAKMSAAQRGYSPFRNLLNEIDARQFSYRSLAELMGISSMTLSGKMRCKQKFTERDKIKLVEIFGKTIEYLLQRDDE